MNKKDYTPYYIYDDPVPYRITKDAELFIYPVRMRDYYKFMQLSQILILDKNSVPDVAVISMSYLEYLLHLAVDDVAYWGALVMLLQTVFKLDNKENVDCFKVEGQLYLKIGKEVFTKTDFDEIREIIIEQNLLSPPDESIQKSLRDKMEEAEAFRRKISGNKSAGIEDQMVSLSIATGIPIESVYDMTIRKFSKSLERIDHKIHYEIYLQAGMSGLVKMKKSPKHWLSLLEKDKFAGLMTYDQFEGSTSGAVEK